MHETTVQLDSVRYEHFEDLQVLVLEIHSFELTQFYILSVTYALLRFDIVLFNPKEIVFEKKKG